MNDWEWFAPVTLTGEDPVAETVVCFLFAETFAYEPISGFTLGIFNFETVEFEAIFVSGVDEFTVTSPASFTSENVVDINAFVFCFFNVWRDDAFDWEVEMLERIRSHDHRVQERT